MNRNKLLRIKDFVQPSGSNRCKENKNQSFAKKAKLCNPSKKSLTCKTKQVTNVKSRQNICETKKDLCNRACKCKSFAKLRFAMPLLTFANQKYAKIYKKLFSQRMCTHLRRELCICKRNAILTNIFWYSVCSTSYTIVRPLMSCLRSNITLACVSTLLPVYPDLSNLKMRYSRNRIRKQIVPTIKFFLNPRLEKAML